MLFSTTVRIFWDSFNLSLLDPKFYSCALILDLIWDRLETSPRTILAWSVHVGSVTNASRIMREVIPRKKAINARHIFQSAITGKWLEAFLCRTTETEWESWDSQTSKASKHESTSKKKFTGKAELRGERFICSEEKVKFLNLWLLLNDHTTVSVWENSEWAKGGVGRGHPCASGRVSWKKIFKNKSQRNKKRKTELKDKFMLIQKNLKCTHSLVLIPSLHECFNIPCINKF